MPLDSGTKILLTFLRRFCIVNLEHFLKFSVSWQTFERHHKLHTIVHLRVVMTSNSQLYACILLIQ